MGSFSLSLCNSAKSLSAPFGKSSSKDFNQSWNQILIHLFRFSEANSNSLCIIVLSDESHESIGLSSQKQCHPALTS